MGHAPEGEQRAELGSPGGGGQGTPPHPGGADVPWMSEHLSFHSLWAHEEQRPRLLTPGVPIPSTCSWEPPECPQGQRTEPPGGEAGTVCRTACRRPHPAAHSRKASFRTEGAVNPGACLLGLAEGGGEKTF